MEKLELNAVGQVADKDTAEKMAYEEGELRTYGSKLEKYRKANPDITDDEELIDRMVNQLGLHDQWRKEAKKDEEVAELIIGKLIKSIPEEHLKIIKRYPDKFRELL